MKKTECRKLCHLSLVTQSYIVIQNSNLAAWLQIHDFIIYAITYFNTEHINNNADLQYMLSEVLTPDSKAQMA